MPTSWKRPLTICLAAVAWCGVLLQCFLSLRLAAENGTGVVVGLGNFLSYFTVLTNLLVCMSLTVPLFEQAARGEFFARPPIIGGVATSIAFVGLAYHFLLRHVWNPQGLQLLANDVLHYITPILFVIYWWLAVPKRSLRWRHPFVWGLYPALYLIFALIRGEIVGRYPYPFIDVSHIGYQRTMINSVVLLLAFFALGLLLVALSRLQRRVPSVTAA